MLNLSQMNPNNDGLKSKGNCLVYIRVSDQKQVNDGLSLSLQEHECKQFAKFTGYNVIKVYSDEGVSGRNMHRDGIIEMMQDISDNPEFVSAICIYSLTRLGRNAAEVLHTIKFLNDLGVAVLSKTELLDSTTPSGQFSITLLAGLAQLESDTIRSRVVPAMRYNAELGEWNGARHIPFGFDNVPLDGQEDKEGRIKKRLTPIEEEAEQVRLIFDLYNNGLNSDKKLGQSLITKHLIMNGYTYRDGTQWTTRKVASVLSNVNLYAGYIEWGRYRTRFKTVYNPVTKQHDKVMSQTGKNKGKPIIERVKNDDYVIAKGKHEAIISEETKQRYLNIYKTRPKAEKKNKGRNPFYLLSGLLTCPDCGNKMIATTEKYGMTYKCRLYGSSGGAICKANTLKEDYVIQRVYSVFYPYFKLMIYLSIPSLILEKSKYDARINNDKEKHFNEIKAKIQTISEQLASDYLRWTNGKMIDELYNNVYEKRSKEIEELKKELEEIDLGMINIEVKEYQLDNLLEELKNYQNIEDYFESLPREMKINYFRRIFKEIRFKKTEGKQGIKSLESVTFVINTKEIRPPKGDELKAIIQMEKDDPRVINKAFQIESKISSSYSLNLLHDIMKEIVDVNVQELVYLHYEENKEERNSDVWGVILNTMELNSLIANEDLELDELTEKFKQLFGHITIED
ncbi:recombinase family protein [Paenibacillus glucanolyticus]|uniref:recombinase family protein n=1 Tax=Paenibacillus glucanolyticus TaxID=59843 RepID=UPI0030D41BE9